MHDRTTFQVLDHETYFMNLTESNLNNKKINWKKEYSAKRAFKLINLLPDQWNNLINQMLNDLNGTLTNKFYKYYQKSSDAAPYCDSICRIDWLLSYKNARSFNNFNNLD